MKQFFYIKNGWQVAAILLSLSLCFLILLTACCTTANQRESSDQSDQSSDMSISTASDSSVESEIESTYGKNWSDVPMRNSFYLRQQAIYPLDLAYQKAIDEATSNIELRDSNDHFAEKWKEKINKYMELLATEGITSDKELEALQKTQEEWENSLQSKIDSEVTLMTGFNAYYSGTIVLVLTGEYNYYLCRERAIELYHLCQMYHVEVGLPAE